MTTIKYVDVLIFKDEASCPAVLDVVASPFFCGVKSTEVKIDLTKTDKL